MEIPFRELQHCNTATHSANKIRKRKIIAEKIKISCEVFVDRNGNVVPLYRQRKQRACHSKATNRQLERHEP